MLAKTPTTERMNQLCRKLTELADGTTHDLAWPAEQLKLCGEAGVFRWFVDERWGGWAWSNQQIVDGYIQLAKSCLTTAFVITQRTAATRRIQASSQVELRNRLLPQLASGERFATVGISHLTTSRRHLQQPALQAAPTTGGYLLNGYSPWVTGGENADTLVLGAEVVSNTFGENLTEKGPDRKAGEVRNQILITVERETPGIETPPPAPLIALNGSCTGQVDCLDVVVSMNAVVAGPKPDVLIADSGSSTGGHQTSALAIGLAAAAIEYLQKESQKRPPLRSVADQLQRQWQTTYEKLMKQVRGDAGLDLIDIRAAANSLVIRATQAAMSAAKGAGYMQGHPVGRWCKEALFFLVWSCPPGVVDANLCELAGRESTTDE